MTLLKIINKNVTYNIQHYIIINNTAFCCYYSLVPYYVIIYLSTHTMM